MCTSYEALLTNNTFRIPKVVSIISYRGAHQNLNIVSMSYRSKKCVSLQPLIESDVLKLYPLCDIALLS